VGATAVLAAGLAVGVVSSMAAGSAPTLPSLDPASCREPPATPLPSAPRFAPAVDDLLARSTPDSLMRRLVEFVGGGGNRHYRHPDATRYVLAELERMGRRPGVEVTLHPLRGFVRGEDLQRTVLVRLAGRNAAAPGVLVGAHLDTIDDAPGPPDAPVPGADDDASGVATLLELYGALQTSDLRFERDLYLAFYAMEEIGLEGSGQLAQWFFERRLLLRGVMQLDMTAFTAAPGRLFFVTDWTNPALTRFTQVLAGEYLDPRVELATTGCRHGEPCSDHVSWCARGYPTVFPFEAHAGESNPRAHTPGDEPRHLDPTHAYAFLRLAAAFLVELAEPRAP